MYTHTQFAWSYKPVMSGWALLLPSVKASFNLPLPTWSRSAYRGPVGRCSSCRYRPQLLPLILSQAIASVRRLLSLHAAQSTSSLLLTCPERMKQTNNRRPQTCLCATPAPLTMPSLHARACTCFLTVATVRGSTARKRNTHPHESDVLAVGFHWHGGAVRHVLQTLICRIIQ